MPGEDTPGRAATHVAWQPIRPAAFRYSPTRPALPVTFLVPTTTRRAHRHDANPRCPTRARLALRSECRRDAAQESPSEAGKRAVSRGRVLHLPGRAPRA